MRIGELDRIKDPDLNDFESYARRGIPFVMTGLARDWPALHWTIEHLEEKCADNTIFWEQYTSDRTRLGWWDHQEGTFRDFLQRMRRGDAVYVTGPTMAEYFQQVMGDLGLPSCIASDRGNEVGQYRIFIGNTQRTEIHYHPGLQSILVHLTGAKRKLVLYPPSETSKLYPFRWYQQVQMSRVLPNRDNEFPRFKDAHYYEYDLEPGDGVFIPIHWWHWAQSQGETIAVAMFFLRKLRDKFDLRLELRDRASAGGERMLRNRPRLAQMFRRFAERSAWGG